MLIIKSEDEAFFNVQMSSFGKIGKCSNILSVIQGKKSRKSLQMTNFQYERYKDDEGIENDLSDIDYVNLPNKCIAQDIGRIALMTNTSVRKAVIIVAKGNTNWSVPKHVGVYKSQLRDLLKVNMTMKEKLLSYDGTFCIHFKRKRTKSYIEGIKTTEKVSTCLQELKNLCYGYLTYQKCGKLPIMLFLCLRSLSNARWNSRAIYCFKAFLLNIDRSQNMIDACNFISLYWAPAWFTSRFQKKPLGVN
ncbi:hypothetical protein A3Q56_01082 [Intoshia linei]|uniref:Uncharacterized protein n=1 Tax=Intoshia linei TaxID=1819745 RepID=A0A177BCD3_9BILA|nr:hypothetical protein A3Q56_01082 [Intoshia linei]